MNHFIHSIAFAAFPHQQHPLPVADLKQMVQKYPYAPALQLLLAARLKETQEPGLTDQWQKTLLYFKDPLLLQYQFFAEQQQQHEMNRRAEDAHVTVRLDEIVTSDVDLVSVMLAERAHELAKDRHLG